MIRYSTRMPTASARPGLSTIGVARGQRGRQPFTPPSGSGFHGMICPTPSGLMEVVGDGVAVDLGERSPPGTGLPPRSSGRSTADGCRYCGFRASVCCCPNDLASADGPRLVSDDVAILLSSNARSAGAVPSSGWCCGVRASSALRCRRQWTGPPCRTPDRSPGVSLRLPAAGADHSADGSRSGP